MNRASFDLKTLFASSSKESGANRYTGILLSSREEIRRLGNAARWLSQQADTTLTPESFLASLSKGWSPKVVAVYNAGEAVGIMYTKQRVISGIPTAVVYADGSLDNILVGNPLHRQNAFRVAVETLLKSPRILGVRLRLLSDSPELDAAREMNRVKPARSQFYTIDYLDSPLWKYHAHLPLADTYDGFLNRLGATTRRNFRHYRRRSEAAGHTFVESLSIDELSSVARDLVPKSEFTARWQERDFEVPLNMVSAARRPLAIGLRHPSGEWLGVIGGWYRPRGAVLCLQLNNQNNFGNESLSLVLRGYLIERLIQQGLDELVIWAETGPPLSRYVSYVPTVGVRFDVPTYSWRAARSFISTIRPLLPKRLAAAAQWIT